MDLQVNYGQCCNETCEQPAPWDMAGIIIFDEIFCSPECAKEGLDRMPDRPQSITLHDPQYVVDRAEIGIDKDRVNIRREGQGSPKTMIDDVAELYGVEFRVREVP